jgi:hypothetical protein
MARKYIWTVAAAKEDKICVSAAIKEGKRWHEELISHTSFIYDKYSLGICEHPN